MPIRSGAMQRPNGSRCGNTLRQRYDEVGLPCNSTMGSPCPNSTYAISLPKTRRRCFWYGNVVEITLGPPIFLHDPHEMGRLVNARSGARPTLGSWNTLTEHKRAETSNRRAEPGYRECQNKPGYRKCRNNS